MLLGLQAWLADVIRWLRKQLVRGMGRDLRILSSGETYPKICCNTLSMVMTTCD